MYNKNSFIKYARNTLVALMTAPVLVAGSGDLVSRLGPTSVEAADWGNGVQAIKKVIPDGEYEARVWNSETAKTEEYFLIIVNKKGGTKVPFGNEAAWTITDLGSITPEGIGQYILRTYMGLVRNPSDVRVEAEKLKNGEFVYIIKKKDIKSPISWGKLYLEGAGTAQSGGGGGGAGGGGSGGGSGGSGGSGGQRWIDIRELIRYLR